VRRGRSSTGKSSSVPKSTSKNCTSAHASRSHSIAPSISSKLAQQKGHIPTTTFALQTRSSSRPRRVDHSRSKSRWTTNLRRRRCCSNRRDRWSREWRRGAAARCSNKCNCSNESAKSTATWASIFCQRKVGSISHTTNFPSKWQLRSSP